MNNWPIESELVNQHSSLNAAIEKTPIVASLFYQAKTLGDHATPQGLEHLLLAHQRNVYDPIAHNHGIKRLLIDGFSGERVWHHPAIIESVCFDDEVIRELETCFDSIENEVLNLIEDLQKFPDSDALTNENGLWSYFPFYEKNRTPISRAHELCPTISRLIRNFDLNTIMGFTFISGLSKKGNIHPHCGSTSLRKRYHLGIKIPDGQKCKIRIGEDWIYWKKGKAFSFYDSVEHEVINDSDKLRLLLIIDVWSDGIPDSIKKCLIENQSILKYGTINSNVKIS
jgi:hypothetical protein